MIVHGLEKDLLTVKNLTVRKNGECGMLTLVDDVSLSVSKGASVGIIGESGSGKTLTALAIMRLLGPGEGWSLNGSIRLNDTELMGLSESELRSYRGRGMAMIFQDPLNALNPVMTCGDQIAEVLQTQNILPPKEIRNYVLRLLDELDFENPVRVYKAYPHELSGGMRQRVLTAVAISGKPDLLIADEPGAMLDFENRQLLVEVIRRYKDQKESGVLLITHDFALMTGFDQIVVMYASRVIESGSHDAITKSPNHPYTSGLLSLKDLTTSSKLSTIPGTILSPSQYKPSCHFADRCDRVLPVCRTAVPELKEISVGHCSACFLNEK